MGIPKRLLIAQAVVAAVVAVGAACTAADNRELVLRFNLKPGQTLRYHGTIAGAGQMTFEGESRPVMITGEFDVSHRTEREKDGAFEITTRFERDKVTLQVAGEQDRSSRVGLPPLKRLMTATGHVLSEKGWEQAPDSANSALVVPLRWFSSSLAAVEFPEKPVKVGETWTQQLRTEGKAQQAAQARQTTTLEGIETVGGRECARLRTAATVPFDMWLPEDPIGTRVHAKGEQRIESTVLFDLVRGVVLTQGASLDLRAETEAQVRGVKEPVRSQCSLAAKVTVELAALQAPSG